jgi:hypothetical protein
MGLFLLTYAATGLSLVAVSCLSGATPRGQPRTPAMTLLYKCYGLSTRRMAVVWAFREPSLGRQVHRELMRSAVLDLTPIIPATACHQRNYVERYSRSNSGSNMQRSAMGHDAPQAAKQARIADETTWNTERMSNAFRETLVSWIAYSCVLGCPWHRPGAWRYA